MSELLKGFERIEEARERFMGPSFMAGLYDGCPDFDLLLPPPEPLEEKAVGDAFCKQIEAFLVRHRQRDHLSDQGAAPLARGHRARSQRSVPVQPGRHSAHCDSRLPG